METEALKPKGRKPNLETQDSTAGGESVAEGDEGRLGLKVGVKGQGALGEAVFARTETLEPGIAVGQAPR